MRRYFSRPWQILVMVLPALILFSLMVVYPIIAMVGHSFTQWDGVSPAVFNGIRNYTRLFKDPIFYVALKNGIIFALVMLVVQIPLATVMALAVLGTGPRTRRFLRISYFVPTVLSITVVCQLWLSIYNAEHGLVNQFFAMFGSEYRQDWLSKWPSSIFAIAITNVWQYMGYQFILILTGARAIPEDYYEAALLDGCTNWHAHLRITIPLLQETYKYCLIIAITGGLNAFSNMYIMTGGGPGYDTYTLTYLMHRAAFRMGQYGYGSAVAVVLVLQCIIVSLVINHLVAREQITY